MVKLSPVVALAVALVPATALAQPAADRARAEALFDEARELMKRGDHEAACLEVRGEPAVRPGARHPREPR